MNYIVKSDLWYTTVFLVTDSLYVASANQKKKISWPFQPLFSSHNKWNNNHNKLFYFTTLMGLNIKNF